MPKGESQGSGGSQASWFTTTHWSVVLAAGAASSGPADEAMTCLCKTYWKPLYNYVRRRGHPFHDAQDLTQEFFACLLAKDFLRNVDRRKGKFRSFLLGAMEHFLANDWRRTNALKRGGGCEFISIDAATESHYLQLAVDHVTPEQLYDQQWAIALQQQALDRLKGEYTDRGNLALYEALYRLIPRAKSSHSRAELAAQLGMTEAALKMALSRMRERYGELVMEEVAKTVSSPEEAEAELRAVFSAWN